VAWKPHHKVGPVGSASACHQLASQPLNLLFYEEMSHEDAEGYRLSGALQGHIIFYVLRQGFVVILGCCTERELKVAATKSLM